MGNPVAQRGKGLLTAVVLLLAENGFMTMAEDDGVIAFTEFSPGKTVHDICQTVHGFRGHLLAQFRTEAGHPPEERQGEKPQQPTGNGASEESPECQVFPVAPVDRITVGNKDSETIERKFRPFRIDVEAESSGKIIFQKEIVVPLAEAYQDSFAFQGRYPFYHRVKTGIDTILPGEPEVEEITRNDEMIHREPPIRMPSDRR